MTARRTAASLVAALVAAMTVATAWGQGPARELTDVAITGDRLGGFVLPIEPVTSDIRITSVKAWAWKVDDTQRLQLEGDVRISVASYEFYSRKAFLWIDRIPSAEGLINQLAIYFPEVEEPTRRAGLGVQGKDLLVTASTRGKVTMQAPVWEDRTPGGDSQRAVAEARLQRYLQQLAASKAALGTRPAVSRPPAPPVPTLEVGGSLDQVMPAPPAAVGNVKQPLGGPAVLAVNGLVSFYGRTIVVDEATDTITVEGSVVIDWLNRNPADPQGTVQLRADRAVIFTVPGTLKEFRQGGASLSAERVEGVYLEGNVVATDFRYTVRAKQVYYDFRTNQALMVDAVLRTQIRRGIPVYARAAEMRQVAANQFTAQQAQVSTSEFFTPHLAVGAERVTVTQRPQSEGGTWIEGRNATFRVGGTPVIGLPRFSGSPDRMPIRSVEVGYNEYRGFEESSKLEFFDALGLQRPDGVEGAIIQDVYSKNGLGGGTTFSLSRGAEQGGLELYGFDDFKNTEQSSAGREYISSNSFRGIASAEYSSKVTNDLLVQSQLNYISDPAFLSTFRQQEFAQHREYESSLFLRASTGNSAFDLLGKYDLDNAVVNSYQLASRPYSVDKLPEVSYRRFGDEFFDLLSWTQEYSANTMQIRVTKGTPESIAAPNAAFFPPTAIPPAPFNQNNIPLGNAYTSAGYDQDLRARLWTRQELAIPFLLGKVKVVPFASASAMGYLGDDFNDYSPDADDYRGVVGGGARISTEFTRVLGDVQSRLLDLNRLRWVVQPNATLWSGYDTASVNDYPIYDQDVEGISAASVAQVGVTQRLQTQRGGPGDWRSVDWVTLDVGAVATDHNNTYQRDNQPNSLHYAQSPAPVFYRWRPEYSQWGSHMYGNASWQVSSTFMLTGSAVALLDGTRPGGGSASDWLARGSVGAAMYHSPEVSTFVEYRYINNFDPTGVYPSDELLAIGLTYKITRLYEISLGPQIDLGQGDFRSATAQIVRVFPDFDFGVGVGYDAITGEYSFNAKLRVGGPNQRGGWGFSQAQPQFASPFTGLLRN
ncbi:MAG: hypothetical protein U0574_02085 [Phycisphaerales bacterium]